jgi:hypothetical protein
MINVGYALMTGDVTAKMAFLTWLKAIIINVGYALITCDVTT